MSVQTDKPFLEALGEILREREGNRLGQVRLGNFIKAVAERSDKSEEYVRLMLNEERPLQIHLVEAAAGVLGLEPSYFLEWRIFHIKSTLERYPELADDVYEVVLAFLANSRNP